MIISHGKMLIYSDILLEKMKVNLLNSHLLLSAWTVPYSADVMLTQLL